jgi:Skp family chaperone for outer membrane proteins
MVSLRIANLNRIFATLDCEKIGNVSKHDVIKAILEILKTEKEHIDDYAEKLAKKRLKNRASNDAAARQKEQMEVQSFVEKSTEMCAVLYQYTLMLNPDEKENAELESLAMSVVTQLERISKQ